MVPAVSALLALLALKLLDKERRSHIDDFNCDEALGLFAWPQRSAQEVVRDRLLLPNRPRPASGLAAGMGQSVGARALSHARGVLARFSLDPLPGRSAALDRHYLPRRGKAGPSVLTFFALEQASRCLCYANANLTRADQNGELMRFVTFWHEITGVDPKWLYFDSKVIDYPELSRVNQRGIHFVTIRRRGTAILRRLEQTGPPRLGRKP